MFFVPCVERVCVLTINTCVYMYIYINRCWTITRSLKLLGGGARRAFPDIFYLIKVHPWENKMELYAGNQLKIENNVQND